MSPLISPEDLTRGHRRLDVRVGPDAARRYMNAHLEGAYYVDLEDDLTGDASDPSVGGRHPLPDVKAFCRTVGYLGIGPETRVVVYDDAYGAKAAARVWWMLRALGHRRVQVLDGGLAAAVEAGHATTKDTPTMLPFAPYPARKWAGQMASVEEVEAILDDPNWCLIDVRSAERYRGEREHLDPVAGHIPGAVNVPLSFNLQPNGRFVKPSALRDLYSRVIGDVPPERTIVSCGSGVTACHTLLAFEHAGMRMPRLFVGSFSEWCRSGRPVETSSPP